MALQTPAITTQHVVVGEKKQRRKRISNRRTNIALITMALPGILILLLLAYLPMGGIVIAFENFFPYEGIFGSPFIGFTNFGFLFGSGTAYQITYNTLYMNSLFIIFGTLSALGIALLINEICDKSKVMVKFYQSAIFFPFLISYILVSYFVYALLNDNNGMVNHLLISFHMQPIQWYASPQYWPTILVLVNLWKTVGMSTMIYLAGMVAINPEFYEAARLDGANKWQQIRFVTLPLMRPLIILLVLLAIGKIFYADFGLFYLVTRNQAVLYSTTDVIDTFVYRALTSLDDLGMSSAAGLYQSSIGFILILLANFLVRRIDPDQAAF